MIVQGEAHDSLWRMDSLAKMLGINSYFEGWYSYGAGSQFPREGEPFDTTVSIHDPFNYGGGPSDYAGSLWSLILEAAQSPEARCYLPGTSGITREYNYPWKFTLGGNDTIYNPLPPIGTGNSNEWFIPDTAVSSSGGYVLKLNNGGDLSPAATAPYGVVNVEPHRRPHLRFYILACHPARQAAIFTRFSFGWAIL